MGRPLVAVILHCSLVSIPYLAKQRIENETQMATELAITMGQKGVSTLHTLSSCVNPYHPTKL